MGDFWYNKPYYMKRSDILPQYWYDLPDQLIANTPAEPRDSARLMIYDTRSDTVTFDVFSNIAQHLPPSSLMVMNNTRVMPARVYFVHQSGKQFEGLILLDQGIGEDGLIQAITRRTPLELGHNIHLGEYSFSVEKKDGQLYYLRPQFDTNILHTIITQHGSTPTPYYIGKVMMDETLLRDRYQTIYAKEASKASIAAPTASLHFTQDTFDALTAKSIARAELTLHVGLGTFGQIAQSNIDSKKLHTEYFEIPPETILEITQAKLQGAPIISVGTTTTRALESSALGRLDSTDLFIFPPFHFQIVDHLITNFHVPQSSLMCLVDAFLQHKQAKKNVVELYQIAIEHKMRFFSFGDAMLIL